MSSINQNKTPKLLYALVDCNNFYVSCERVFDPRLIGKPVVVLSGNDGCIVSRSKEAKLLGIPMGAPAFEYQEVFKKYDVKLLSSNFTLYGDMSNRVMQTLELFSDDIQIYSIDEAFLQLDPYEIIPHCREIQRIVLQHTGIPISIGIGPNMTLSKVANDIAKKYPYYQGVFSLESPEMREKVLKKLPVEDVWGIGRKTADYLRRQNIHTAGEFIAAEDGWIKSHLSVTGLRMAFELRGISCLSLDDSSSSKKSITCSRSFNRPVSDLDELLEAVASYTSRAAEKLRSQGSLASYIDIFLTTNRHQSQSYYANQIQMFLAEPSDYTPRLIQHAKEGLRRIFRSGFLYKKTGITLGGLLSNQSCQLDLFSRNAILNEKEDAVMQLIDQLNHQYGRQVVKIAAEGITQSWKSKHEKRSPLYTTSWDGILTI